MAVRVYRNVRESQNTSLLSLSNSETIFFAIPLCSWLIVTIMSYLRPVLWVETTDSGHELRIKCSISSRNQHSGLNSAFAALKGVTLPI